MYHIYRICRIYTRIFRIYAVYTHACTAHAYIYTHIYACIRVYTALQAQLQGAGEPQVLIEYEDDLHIWLIIETKET